MSSGLSADEKSLVDAARAARETAYCPYSSFRVGAALLTKSGVVIPGCNVENASYGLSICAERTALVSAVSQGHVEFSKIAVITDMDDNCSPCGACRQFMAEFGLDIVVLMQNDVNGSCERTTVGELLPRAFTPKTLAEADELRLSQQK